MKPTDHPIDQIHPSIRRIANTAGIPVSDIGLISPDEGAAKRYDLSKYGVLTFIGGKKRDAATGKLTGFEMKLNSLNEMTAFASLKAALIVDDICDGGGTFIGLAQEIKKINPTIKLGLFTSHGIYSKGLAPLRAEFDWVITSDYTYHATASDLGIHFKTGDEKTPGVCIR